MGEVGLLALAVALAALAVELDEAHIVRYPPCQSEIIGLPPPQTGDYRRGGSDPPSLEERLPAWGVGPSPPRRATTGVVSRFAFHGALHSALHSAYIELRNQLPAWGVRHPFPAERTRSWGVRPPSPRGAAALRLVGGVPSNVRFVQI